MSGTASSTKNKEQAAALDSELKVSLAHNHSMNATEEPNAPELLRGMSRAEKNRCITSAAAAPTGSR